MVNFFQKVCNWPKCLCFKFEDQFLCKVVLHFFFFFCYLFFFYFFPCKMCHIHHSHNSAFSRHDNTPASIPLTHPQLKHSKIFHSRHQLVNPGDQGTWGRGYFKGCFKISCHSDLKFCGLHVCVTSKSCLLFKGAKQANKQCLQFPIKVDMRVNHRSSLSPSTYFSMYTFQYFVFF